MRFFIPIVCVVMGFAACKNNAQSVAKSQPPAQPKQAPVKDIIVQNFKPTKPDFRVLEMSNENDILTVIVQYGGGCKEHDFNAYFSGGWAKSLPPQAALYFEHLNPDNDPCRSIVRDTLYFNLTPVRYSSTNEVVVKWATNPDKQTLYRYEK